MKDGFLRVAAATPPIRVADTVYNTAQIKAQLDALPVHTAVAVFPELCVTGYTCSDLFLQPALLRAAEAAVRELLDVTLGMDTVVIVGVPVSYQAELYNCAAVLHKGRLLGLVPKANLPSYSEFYEGRQFTPAPPQTVSTVYAGQDTRLGRNLLFRCRSLPDFCLGVEICEDLWAGTQPSQQLAAAGATVIANLSASDESIGKADFRRQLVSMQSARLNCAYIYADAGEGESTTDLVFAGQNLIAEDGTILAESARFTTGIVSTEIDLQKLCYERRRISSFETTGAAETIEFDRPVVPLELTRPINPLPFVPQNAADQNARCEEVLSIQTAGLARRLEHTRSCAVLGLSGGLDSALALLVTVRAFDRLGRSRADIHAVTMPCFGTTSRTLNNARTLATACGATLHEIDITASVRQHLQDIGHDGAHDVTYENAQARERTQVLMDLANRLGGLVVGTGDLSELALGWATFNGDHMSMYGVNCSVPKTLVRYLVAYEADHAATKRLRKVLRDILDTPVSPELLPAKEGEIAQKTEEIVGPYDLHDFFIYNFVRLGYGVKKIYRVAKIAFDGVYDGATIKKWLGVFVRRFFAQQFKRSCVPDGVKVGSVALSPRGDLRMPSDACAKLWLDELEEID